MATWKNVLLKDSCIYKTNEKERKKPKNGILPSQ